MTKEKDKRFIKSKNQIVGTFKQMMEKLRFEEISVSGLCKQAKIDRKTFYLHYKSTEELLSEILDDMNNEFIDRMKGRDIAGIDELIREHILFITEQGDFFERILIDDAYSYIASRNLRRFFAAYPDLYKPFDTLGTDKADIAVAFVNSAYLQMYTQWVLDGKRVPTEEFIALATQLLQHGIAELVGN